MGLESFLNIKLKHLRDLLQYLFTNPFFLSIFLFKLLVSIFFIGELPRTYFIPFINEFVTNFGNPYELFFENNFSNAFPYPPLMLYIMSFGFLLFSKLSGLLYGFINLDLLILRIPLLIFDIFTLFILISLNYEKKKQILFLYWASPVIFFINYIHGQLDIIPICLLLFSLLFLFKKRFFMSSLFLAFSLLTKSNVAIALPFYFLYLFRRKFSLFKIITYFVITGFIYIIFILPFIFSEGFIKMVYFSKEQFKIFDLNILFPGETSFYIIVAIYLYLLFKAFSLRKITFELLFLFIGITFTMFVTLIKPSIGWYLWPVSIIIYFLSKTSKNYNLIYYSFGGVFFIYGIINQYFGIQALYNNIIFTILTSSLIYFIYLMYRFGLKSNFLFEDSGVIPTIGVAGNSGSGKTTLTKSLKGLFSSKNVTIIYGDDVHKWERGNENWNKLTHLNPISNRLHSHYKDIKQLKSGSVIYRSHYDHSTGKFTDKLSIKPKNVIIDEGLHTFLIEQKELYDLKIFMFPDEDLNMYWKFKRDIKERGHTKEKIMESIKKREKDYNKFIKPQVENADLVISLIPTEENCFDELGVNFFIKTQIDVEPLLDKLAKYSKLDISFEYSNLKTQSIKIFGNVHSDIIKKILKELDLQYYEFDLNLKSVNSGIDGLVQLFTYYCFYNNLKMKRSENI